jgi:hypothetical protein
VERNLFCIVRSAGLTPRAYPTGFNFHRHWQPFN